MIRTSVVVACAVPAIVAGLYLPHRVAFLLGLGACVYALIWGMLLTRKRRSGRLSAAELAALEDTRRRLLSTLARFRTLLTIWLIALAVSGWFLALALLIPYMVYVAMGLFVFGTVPLVIGTRSVIRRLFDRVLAAPGGGHRQRAR